MSATTKKKTLGQGKNRLQALTEISNDKKNGTKVLTERKGVIKEYKPAGRPSHRKDGKAYLKMTTVISEESFIKLNVAFASKLRKEYRTKSELIEFAINKLIDES